MVFISDVTIQGVINGWNTYVTGSMAITMFLVLLLLFVFGMIFRINTAIIFIFLIPFALLSLAYIGRGFGGVIIILIGLFLAWGFSQLKR